MPYPQIRNTTVFGTEYNLAVAQSLRSQWQSGNFSQLPTIQVISDEILGNARGAYASSTNSIYLSDQFVETASPQVGALMVISMLGIMALTIWIALLLVT